MKKESNMPDDMRTELRKAIWTIVTVGILGVSGVFVQTMVAQSVMQEQIDVIKQEQDVIRQKIDLLYIGLGRKVDRETMDDCLHEVNIKLDRISQNVLEIYKNTKK